MPIDPSIAMGFKPPQLDSPVNALAQMLKVQSAQQDNQLGQAKLDEYKRTVGRQNLVFQTMQQLGKDATDDDRTNALKSLGEFDAADKVQAGQLARTKTNADAQKATADALKSNADVLNIKLQHHRDQLGPVNSPDAAASWVAAMYNDPDMASIVQASGRSLEQQVAAIPKDPKQFAQWKMQSSLGANKLVQFTTPDANTVANNATSAANNAATNATSRSNAQLQASTSRQNNQDTIKKDLTVAGLNADGTPGIDTEATAQAIAKGQLPPPTGMALMNPKNQRVLGRVMEINPDYDYTTVAAKKAAATAFTTGTQGNALRAASTANAHLDQLGELADALGNGNLQIINKAKIAYQSATGSAAPTNFDGIKNIVGQEVVKAIVAGGGSAGERDEAAKTFSSASSPDQLKQAIQHYRMVMQAQADNLLEQRRAAGLPDSTLPNYKKGASAPPPTNAKGWTLHVDAAGNKAYVAPNGKDYEEVH
jgi:hypothetical protein